MGLDGLTELMRLVRRAYVESELARPYAAEMVDSLLRQVLIQIYRYTEHNQVKEAASSPSTSQSASIAQAIEYIHLHLDQPIKIDEVAAVSGYSEPHFRRIFKMHTQMSPSEYIREARVRRAQVLLNTGHFSVGEVSKAVGYTDQFHFSRMFKAVVGKPPRFVLELTATVVADREMGT